MADPIALRRPVLATGVSAGSAATATVVPAPAATRFVLRLAPEAAAAKGIVAGFDLGGAINTVRGGASQFAARLGPNEWLLVAPEAGVDALAAALEAGLADVFHSLVDVSHRNTAVLLEGAAVADVLNAGCPLDLAAAAFPAGSATRTILGKAEIILVRPSDASAWRVECWRSFAPYVMAYLAEAAR